MVNQIANKSIEEFLRDVFEDNFEYLKSESGHTIAPALKEIAWQHVILYWAKLKELALKVTETEVKLVLPDQKTPGNKRYTIEGVVDIVQENDKLSMYDLKTHDAEQVRANKDLYIAQLSVYAHIWQNLRGQKLDAIAIIATGVPQALKDAYTSGNPKQIKNELAKWDPVVVLDLNQSKVNDCIDSFGDAVDKIESSIFIPKPAKQLHDKVPGRNVSFGVAACRYCDGRFSCDSYLEFVAGKVSAKSYTAMKYYLDDYGEEEEREQWIETLLDVDM